MVGGETVPGLILDDHLLGTGDGVTVWNAKGLLLGKIFIGSGAANFQWAGPGR